MSPSSAFLADAFAPMFPSFSILPQSSIRTASRFLVDPKCTSFIVSVFIVPGSPATSTCLASASPAAARRASRNRFACLDRPRSPRTARASSSRPIRRARPRSRASVGDALSASRAPARFPTPARARWTPARGGARVVTRASDGATLGIARASSAARRVGRGARGAVTVTRLFDLQRVRDRGRARARARVERRGNKGTERSSPRGGDDARARWRRADGGDAGDG